MTDKTLLKSFLYNLVSVELGETYIILNESVVPSIKSYMKLLIRIPYNEETYHTFYGNVKNIIESFYLYWAQVMDNNIDIANGYIINLSGSTRSQSKEIVLHLIEKTINARTIIQNDFIKEFSEINSEFDVKILENDFRIHLEKIQELLKLLKTLDNQELQKFITANISLALSSEHKIFEFACNQFATFLSDNHMKILISLEENLKRVSRNLQSLTQIQSHKEDAYAVSNNVCCHLLRKDVTKNDASVESKVTEEFKHWQRRIHEFQNIKNNLNELQRVQDKLTQQHSEQAFNGNVTEEISQKLEEINKLKISISKSILSFFCVEGANRLYHSDPIGQFFVDEYGHRVYSINYGLNRIHTFGDFFVETHEDVRPTYDENGRYVMKDSQKLYKAAQCCSAYKLDDCGIFIKENYGHPNQCKEAINKYGDTTKAQQKEFENFKVKLNKKEAIYLWNSLGDILTKSLLDVAKQQPENPLHRLAHTLLYHKYHKKSKDTTELAEKFVPYTGAVFKITKKSQVEHHKIKEADDDQEIISATFNKNYSNIVREFLFEH